MLAQQNNTSYLHTMINEGETYAFCRKCRTMQGIELFEPATHDIPPDKIPHNEINWFDKFTIYQPLFMKLLKTTHTELAAKWNVSTKSIERALESQRLLIDMNGDWYINSYEWEPQSICWSCRNPEFPKYGDENSVNGYLRLLKEQEAA